MIYGMKVKSEDILEMFSEMNYPETVEITKFRSGDYYVVIRENDELVEKLEHFSDMFLNPNEIK